MGFLMNSAVTIALPTIQETLGVELDTIQWIVNAYVVTLGGLILVSGSLGDIFGVRRVYAAGILWFTVASVLCGLAPTPAWLIAARALQGVGAALMVPGSLAVITRVFPQDERGRAIGLWAGVSGAIAALGPFIGGFLTSVSWRLVFVAAAVPGIAAFWATLRYVPRLPGSRKGGVDVTGATLVLVALSAASYGLIRLQNQGGAPVALALLGLSVASVGAFLIVERRQQNPILPFAMFDRPVVGANIITFLVYFSFQGIFFVLSFHLQQLLGFDSRMAGLALLPTTALITLLSGPSGSITDRVGPRPQLIAGPIVIALGVAAMVLFRSSGSYAVAILPGTVLLGLGMVLVIPSVTSTALNVAEAHTGAASGFNNAAARVAGLFAVASLGTLVTAVFRARLAAALAELPISGEARSAVLSRAGALLAMELPEGLPQTAVEGIRRSLEASYLAGFTVAMIVVATLLCAAAVAAALTVGERSRDFA